MKDYTISEASEIIKKSFANYDKQGTTHWTWETAAQDLSYQVGSLHKIMLQMTGKRWADAKDTEQLEAGFRDELADILAEVLFIAQERGINMNIALDEMIQSDTNKVTARSAK